jgi:hypothetical protein
LNPPCCCPCVAPRAKGPLHTSLGRSPRSKPGQNPQGLKARPIPHHLPPVISTGGGAFAAGAEKPASLPIPYPYRHRALPLLIAHDSWLNYFSSNSQQKRMSSPQNCRKTDNQHITKKMFCFQTWRVSFHQSTKIESAPEKPRSPAGALLFQGFRSIPKSRPISFVSKTLGLKVQGGGYFHTERYPKLLATEQEPSCRTS